MNIKQLKLLFEVKVIKVIKVKKVSSLEIDFAFKYFLLLSFLSEYVQLYTSVYINLNNFTILVILKNVPTYIYPINHPL